MNECWEWRGSRNKQGYGRKAIGKRDFFTHRLAWAWVNGPIPDGMCVLHRCDNPPCCNPDHLFLGTKQDNVRDMDSKGRRSRKTHCKRGHALELHSSLYRYTYRGKEKTNRVCLLCRAERNRQRYQKSPALASIATWGAERAPA